MPDAKVHDTPCQRAGCIRIQPCPQWWIEFDLATHGMLSKSSVHSIQRLIMGAQGVGILSLDRELRIHCATPLAETFCQLPAGGVRELPQSLQDRLREAIRHGTTQLSWLPDPLNIHNVLTGFLFNIHDDRQGTDGYILILQDGKAQIREESHLRRCNAILNALTHLDWQLHTDVMWEQSLPDTMARIGLAAGYDRIQVFRNFLNGDHTARLAHVHRWEAGHEDAEPADFPGCPRWLRMLQNGQPFAGFLGELPAMEQRLLVQRGMHSLLLVPVFVGDEWWGGISFERRNPHAPASAEELNALMAIGRSLGTAIQRQLAGERLHQVKIAFDSTTEGIMICDDKQRITAVNRGFTNITGYSEEEALGRTPGMLSSGKHDQAFYANLWDELDRNGCWRGEVWNRRKDGDIYPQWLTITSATNHAGEISHYIAVFADISEAKESQQRLQRMVNHDPLTGLPNRRLLNELLERAMRNADRSHQHIALLFVDLDRFKTINDTLGHHMGDLLLSGVTQRLSAAVREADTVARLGGDEFVIMMDNLQDPDDAAVVAQKVISTLQQSFVIEKEELFIGASIGISIYPRDGAHPQDLIRAADIAMYQAKNEGRNGFRFYTRELGQSAHERLTLDTMLRHALERNQLVVHYQPQISLESGRIIGAEALVRWEHPHQGTISPSKFIPLAEETGLIIQIGEWVLREAARDLVRLEESGCLLEWISVNVSATQIHRSNFPDTVMGVLIETGCNPERLELEITESAIMNGVEYVTEVCRKLKDMGVSLALDDFGTGYSSLSYLKRFPLDKLKIDQSFVRELPHDADDMAISGAIIALGHNLGLTVIAEGVEKAEQEAFLRTKGCQQAQGFLYSRPIPFASLLELLLLEENQHP